MLHDSYWVLNRDIPQFHQSIANLWTFCAFNYFCIKDIQRQPKSMTTCQEAAAFQPVVTLFGHLSICFFWYKEAQIGCLSFFKSLRWISFSYNLKTQKSSLVPTLYLLFILGADFAIKCLKVCRAWRKYLHNENIWRDLYTLEIEKSKMFVTEARTSVSGVGNGWLNLKTSDFIIRKLDFEFLKYCNTLSHGRSSDIFKAVKSLSENLMLAQKIKSKPLQKSSKEMVKFLFNAEKEAERYRRQSLLPYNNEAMFEFLLSTSEECGYAEETFFQVFFVAFLLVSIKN